MEQQIMIYLSNAFIIKLTKISRNLVRLELF